VSGSPRTSAGRVAVDSSPKTADGGVATTRRRARRGQGQALRDEILAAAAVLLAETGDEDAVSIRAVAERVGVTPPSIYLHFADKETMLEAVCVESFGAFESRIAEASATASDPVDALKAIGQAYVGFALERPEHYRYMFMRRPAPHVLELTPAELETLSGLGSVIDRVRAAQEQGLIDGSRDVLQVSYSLWSATHGIAALLIAKPHFPWGDRGALINSVLEMALYGAIARR
jgi:AcrR family transcriptional regulator